MEGYVPTSCVCPRPHEEQIESNANRRQTLGGGGASCTTSARPRPSAVPSPRDANQMRGWREMNGACSVKAASRQGANQIGGERQVEGPAVFNESRPPHLPPFLGAYHMRGQRKVAEFELRCSSPSSVAPPREGGNPMGGKAAGEVVCSVRLVFAPGPILIPGRKPRRRQAEGKGVIYVLVRAPGIRP